MAVKYLSEIITARVREIMEAVLYEIQESGLAEHLRCGIVITGGAARTANLGMMVNEMSGYNVRIGYPRYDIAGYEMDGVHETSATTILGLITAAMKEETANCAVDTGMPFEKVETEEVKVVVAAEEVEEVSKTEVKVTEDVETEIEEDMTEEADEDETEVKVQVNHTEEKKEEENEEKEKAERWKFLKVVWGKAQNIGANINKIIDGITVDDEESDEE